MREDHVSIGQTRVAFGSDARDKLYEGMKIAAHAVCCTLGPKGKTVLIQGDNNVPIVTKDGVSVSKAINLRDPVMRMGANLIKEAANRTNDVAGDGTTTATALSIAIVTECRKLMASGHDQRHLREGVSAAVKDVVDEIKSAAVKLTTREQIVHVATISANGDAAIGTIVADAFERVGRDGVITVEDAKGTSTTLDVVEGMQFDRGYLSPYFVTNQERMHALYQDCYVLVTDRRISTLQDIVGVLEHVHRAGKPLLIIADDIEGEALQALVLNRVKANLAVVAIKAPGFGQLRDALLGDICVLSGAGLVSPSTGVSLKDASAALGQCKRVIVDSKTTVLVGHGGTAKAITERVNDLRSQLDDPTLDIDNILQLKQRVARLAGGVAIVKVGGVTELEMIERKYRIEDALNATRAAMEEGIVVGGGTALYEASIKLDVFRSSKEKHPSFNAGYGAVLDACIEPLRKIAQNTGKSHDVVLDRLATQRIANGGQRLGYDAATDTIVDMFERGIIDPVKVTRTALENAASVAVLFISLGAVVSEDDGACDGQK